MKHKKVRKKGHENVSFFKQFMTNPLEVGSVIPSSGALSEAMLRNIDFESLNNVVELGPGTGSFSRRLTSKLTADTNYYAVESNPHFCQIIKKDFPNIKLINDYAENLSQHVPDLRKQVDLIVSGLPFSFMTLETIDRTLLEIYSLLKEGGELRLFTYLHALYLPKIRYLLNELQSNYLYVNKKFVGLNIPPAFVISCQK